MNTIVTLEKGVRFSKSKLWQLQRDFYYNKGADAWAGYVPFYITSNPVIADRYAQVTIAFIKDYIKNQNYVANQPFYIFELGAGSGRFSYYCMKRIFELQQNLGLDGVDICYVMTDFSNNNINFWKEHELLLPYIEQNKLDFCCYDMENQESLTLEICNIKVKKGDIKNPILVFGNYIFDTVTSDVFHIENGKIQEAYTLLTTQKSNIDEENQPKDLSEITTTFFYRDIPDNYYGDPNLDNILSDYSKLLHKSSLLFPIGGLVSLKNLKQLTTKSMLLISTDKGYSFPSEMEGRHDPQVVFHGSFSMMVNFHAIGKYTENCGGETKHQAIRKGIKTSLFLFNEQFVNLPETNVAIDNFVEDFGPGDYFNFHTYLKKTKQECNLTTIISHLHFCRYDPHVFKFFIEFIVKQLPEADQTEIDALKFIMPKIFTNIYPMPGFHDSYFDIGIFYHAIQEHADALHYYKHSLEAFSKQFTTIYNIGLSYHGLKDYDQALIFLKRAQEIKPHDKEVKEWIKRIHTEQNQE